MKFKKVKVFLETKKETKAARKNLEEDTRKSLKDSDIANIKATKKARETIWG